MKKSKRRIIYEKHIASPEWKKKRLERLKIDNNKCRLCDSTDRLEVHHRWPSGYYNIPDENIRDDLTTLCHEHHMATHDVINRRKYLDEEPITNNVPKTKKRKLTSYGVENSEIPTSRNLLDDTTQRRFGQSDESDSEGDEINFWKTKKDRGRFRGIG